MKLKSLFLALLVMFSGVVMAQVSSGKVYRIVSSKYETVITASPITNALSCVTKGGNTDYQQMWEFTLDEASGKYSIQNVFSRRYIQNETGTNVAFKTGNSVVLFAVTENADLKGHYNIDASDRKNGWGLHCASGASVVPWSYGSGAEVSGTEWTFEEVSITQLEKDNAYDEYVAYNNVLENKTSIIEKVSAMFEDKAGTTLKSTYASMSDANLIAALDGVPTDLQQAILKIKNNTWKTEERAHLSEKNFRIYDYKPYSNPEKWKDVLYHRPFNRINNPTGICSESDKGFIYIWVDKIPEGTYVDLAEMSATAYFGPNTHWDEESQQQRDVELVEGLNIIPSAVKDGVLYIRYICDTDLDGKKLADYPTVKVHIEGGYVNGFWSKERGHTNADWVYMGQKMFRNETAIQAVGDHSMLNFRKYEFLQPFEGIYDWGYKVQGCPEQITEVMAFWDFWNERQKHYMGLDKYYDWFNNKQLAMSDDGGFMDAGNYRTHYNNNTLTTIVNIDRISRDGGSAWGPNHEIGHTNQYAFELVGTSEVSNNALANFAIFDTGTHTSRGNNLENQILDFENNVPYVARGEKMYGQKLFSMTRMYFQLFLYFHAAGKNPEFYPTLFEELRKDKLVGWSTTSNRDHGGGECNGAGNHPTNEYGYVLGSMDATHDQLKFVEKCCSIAQMDLTEFFEAWGFFIPMKNVYVGDYGHHHVYLTQGAIDSCKARIQAANYPKKGGHLMFLEDRVRPSKKKKSLLNNDENGYRIDYSNEVPVGTVGKLGQWEDYIDENVKAQGYYYAVSDGVVTIIQGDGAKGALGFKLYDADTNKLITYTNNYSMNIPVFYSNCNYKVAAAQANGEDYIVPHASQGPESMQLDALDKSLKTAKKYTVRKTANGTAIGYFYPSAVEYLTELYKEAKAAYDNKDKSKRSFAEWSIMLDNECKRLISTEGPRVLFEEGMEVNIYSSSGRTLTNTYSGLVASLNTTSEKAAARWSIEYAGETDVYYLKSADGYYIKDFAYNDIVYADVTSPAAAARFTIGYTDDGDIYFNRVGEGDPAGLAVSNKYVSVDGKDQPAVKGSNPSDAASMWYAYVYENKSAEFYKQEFEDALTEARMTIIEVLNLDSISAMNIFNDNVIVKDRNLETYIIDLYNQYIKINPDAENASKHKAYLTTLRELLKKIEGTYCVTSPIATKGETTAWYRLVDSETGEYLSVSESTTATNKERLALSSDLNDVVLWSFAPTGVPNEFKVYNYEYKGYIAQKADKNANNLYVVADNAKPLTVVYNAEKNAVILKSADKYVRKSGSYVGLGTESNAAFWTLELVALDTDIELSNVESIFEEGNSKEGCYDLSGRRVINPTKGIYIQNGKKVYVK